MRKHQHSSKTCEVSLENRLIECIKRSQQAPRVHSYNILLHSGAYACWASSRSQECIQQTSLSGRPKVGLMHITCGNVSHSTRTQNFPSDLQVMATNHLIGLVCEIWNHYGLEHHFCILFAVLPCKGCYLECSWKSKAA